MGRREAVSGKSVRRKQKRDDFSCLDYVDHARDRTPDGLVDPCRAGVCSAGNLPAKQAGARLDFPPSTRLLDFEGNFPTRPSSAQRHVSLPFVLSLFPVGVRRRSVPIRKREGRTHERGVSTPF
jgi:hypothetical protein